MTLGVVGVSKETFHQGNLCLLCLPFPCASVHPTRYFKWQYAISPEVAKHEPPKLC